MAYPKGSISKSFGRAAFSGALAVGAGLAAYALNNAEGGTTLTAGVGLAATIAFGAKKFIDNIDNATKKITSRNAFRNAAHNTASSVAYLAAAAGVAAVNGGGVLGILGLALGAAGVVDGVKAVAGAVSGNLEKHAEKKYHCKFGIS